MNNINYNKITKLFLTVYIIATVTSVGIIAKSCENTSILSEGLSGDTLGILSVAAVYPITASLDEKGTTEEGLDGLSTGTGKDGENQAATKDKTAKVGSKSNTEGEKDKSAASAGGLKNDDKPEVLIVHTHATESYLPASSGNYHTTKEANTVRDVGNVMMKFLQKKGVKVYHDKTIHDNPSYNESYSKCYETVESLLKKYPSIKCVIDLHRDAIPSSVEAETHKVNGNTCAAYSFVIGSLATTVESNRAFIQNINSTASKRYNGFSGEVMSRGYTYNQSLCKKYLLLEIGNNRNTIKEARNTAMYLAKVIGDNI